MQPPQIKLKKGKDTSLMRYHPWVFSGAIQNIPKNILDGDIVDIYSNDNQYLASGHYQSGASIAVRIITFEHEEIGNSFWNHKIESAINYRTNLMLPNQNTNTYRLFHGEGDGIPGLIIDVYNDIFVVQCHSIGVHKSILFISESLKKCFGANLDSIYIRAKETLPTPYNIDIADTFTYGSKAETIVLEHGISFKINVITGQKTGFFLDQRENRAFIQQFSKDKSVLNLFCYTGGFSLYALSAGANRVDSVDISQKAIDLLDENITINEFQKNHTSHCANVMQYLQDDQVPQYDLVIADPPAFAKSLHKRHNAVQAYKRLNILALKKVKKGGMLLTFSCSQVVGSQLFYDTIVAAGIETKRKIRVIQSMSQGGDHPINLFHPEGHYLKGLALYIE